MKKNIIITLVIFISLLFAQCTKEKKTMKDALVISVSIYPIYDITRNLSVEKNNIQYIVPPGANPHTYEPVPSGVRSLQGTDLFIGISKEFDGWIEKFLPGSATVKYLSDAGHDDNPHIWLSINNAKKISRQISETLTMLDPGHKDEYKKQLNIYLKKLARHEIMIVSHFDSVKNNKIIQYHRAWDFFARDTGLKIISTIEDGHGKRPSIKKFKEIIDTAKKLNTGIIVMGLRDSDSSVISLAKEINGTVIRLSTMGSPDNSAISTYLDMMMTNSKKLSKALKGR